MRTIVLTIALFSSCVAAEPSPGQLDTPIQTYLEEAAKKIELEQIVARYSRSSDATAKASVNELRPQFGAAYEAAAASEDAREALDEHWLVVNRCLNGGGGRGACKGDLAAAGAKVDLKWSRHNP